ncbi:MAG TPA: acyltransferase domain-containing protein [Microlunatus sp.]
MLDVGERLSADDLPERLTLLGFREDDRADTLAAAAAVLRRPGDVSAVQAMADRLIPAVGVIGDPWGGSLPWPWRAEGADSAFGAGVLELLALIACIDEVRAYHASRGIGADDSWRALSDLGQQVFVHRLTYSTYGLHTHDWLRVAWSGALYWLGRLQFNLQRDPLEPGEAGTWVLSTHIPRSGPLTPAEVDASFAAAQAFFAEHFDDFSVHAFHCHSWLLDPRLAAALPATSNMAQFQRRWTLAGESGNGDEDAVFFTFARRPPVDLASLPRETTLQRAILDRIADGGHWHVRHGFITFADQLTAAERDLGGPS